MCERKHSLSHTHSDTVEEKCSSFFPSMMITLCLHFHNDVAFGNYSTTIILLSRAVVVNCRCRGCGVPITYHAITSQSQSQLGVAK